MTDPYNENLMQQPTLSNITPTRVLTQQIFHKGMFENRPRSYSASEILTTTPQRPNTQKQVSPNTSKEGTGKKRLLSSPDSMKGPSKQSKLNTYWLSQTQPVPTSNRFALLENDESQKSNHEQVEKPIKPPPIFVDKVENIQPLISLLNEHVRDNYELKVLKNDQVKIQPKTSEAYRDIVKQLEIKNTEFYTYRPKQDRSFKVVLKNLHASTDLTELSQALLDLGHECVNTWNIKQRKTKKPLPMFIVELKPSDNNKSIYQQKEPTHHKKHLNQKTYRDVVREKPKTTDKQDTIPEVDSSKSDTHELIIMMKQMMQQLTTMTNLLLTLTTRLTNSMP
ncbi:hypothetical protein PYW07_010485 [Mythimna separata]|uniref:Pre-C2HC domain-containing protein n=1 Tax=Mythimna separata TaxID=271217 RepID=A0AAD8DMB3_MYTSE|nr:hypothetical protein PYW07_010485 [Mythimna separata]